MLTPKEALEKRRASSGAAHQSQLEDKALDAANLRLNDTNEQPNVIIGGHWPSKIHGSRRVECADCGSHLCLSPDSGYLASLQWPKVPVICFKCALKREHASR